FSQDKPAFSSRSLLDRWVVSRYDLLVREIRENLDVYEVSRAAKAVENFVIEDLSNWYIRRSRRRFWKSGWDADKNGAYFTLFEILEGLVKCIAPFLPFTSEMVYHCLMKGSPSQKESVHLEDYPVSQDHRVDLELVLSMDVARKLTNLGRAVRNKVNIKTRQPLRQAILVIPQENERRLVTQFADIIQEELNVKEIQWSDSLPPEVEVILKPRFAILGPRFGQEVKTIARLLSRLEKEKAVRFLSEGFLSLSLPSGPVELHLEEVDVLLKTEGTLSIESTEGYAVLLDTEIDDELRNEGLIREIVHTVQLFRKEAGFDVDDRIDLFFHETTDENAKMLLQKYQEFIKEETLSRDIHWGPSVSEEFTREFLLDEMKICLSLER
ncbi:MAG: DUF5915 domain-containing protein, partial [Candidatus Atribacteria bacterium]|nr:DUF5915 domain-containing protein [Candidatus Atribacteria bacterium]